MILISDNDCSVSCDVPVMSSGEPGPVEWRVLFKKWWTPSSPTHHLPRQIMSRVLILLHLRHLGRLSPRRASPLVGMVGRVRAESQWEAEMSRHRWAGEE